MISHILLDQDGVITDIAAANAHVFGFDFTKDLTKGPIGQWPFFELLVGLSHKEYWDRIGVLGEAYWENQQPYSWAAQLFEICEALAPTYILTQQSPTNDPVSLSGKLKWITRFKGPRYRNCAFVPDKSLLAKPGVVLIDDLDENVDKFIQAGGYGIVFPRLWNSNHSVSADPISYLRQALSAALRKLG